MAFNPIDQSFPRNRKTLRLAHRLQIKKTETSDRHQLMGHLVTFWLWALDNATVDGRLSGVSDEEIAAAAEWIGDPHRFVSALIDAGFLERDMDTTDICIHDWGEYGGKLIVERAFARERKRRQRHGERHADVTRDSAVTSRAGHATEKSRVEKTREEQSREDPAAAAAPEHEDFGDDALSETDEAVGRLCRSWENATGTTVTAAVGDAFAAWLEKLPEAAIVKAIAETGASGSKAWRYCEAILQRYLVDGWADGESAGTKDKWRATAERLDAIRTAAAERGVL